ncbi:MAG: septal ring lytic transglycosylase RlpA family protein [Chitinispirillaceae bacterium]|nr:septal ring lytic transglycosylase RlpA family protein [Chitinispirillaceae bacterium]
MGKKHRTVYSVILILVYMLLQCTGSPRYTRGTPDRSTAQPVKKSPVKYPSKSVATPKKGAAPSPSVKKTSASEKEVKIETAFAPEMRIPAGPSIAPPDDIIREKIKTQDFSFYQKGQASYYSDKLHGRKTASGERYNKKAMTAAHRKLPFNTVVKVTSTRTGKSVVVRINDRGPFTKGRIIDLSRAAAERVGMVKSGVAHVIVEVQEKGK